MSKNFILFYLVEGVNQVGNIFTDTLKLKTEKKPIQNHFNMYIFCREALTV